MARQTRQILQNNFIYSLTKPPFPVFSILCHRTEQEHNENGSLDILYCKKMKQNQQNQPTVFRMRSMIDSGTFQRGSSGLCTSEVEL